MVLFRLAHNRRPLARYAHNLASLRTPKGHVQVPTGLFIGNEFVRSRQGSVLPVINPATEESMLQVEAAQEEDVNDAVQAATDALDGLWSKLKPSERARLLFNLSELIQDHAQELACLESLDSGKPFHTVMESDLGDTLDCFRYFAGWADKIQGRSGGPYDNAYTTYTRHEPIGVIGAIIPWNYPLMMMAWKLGPSLACGNTVVIKPSEHTALSALKLGELIRKAGFPSGVVNIVPGLGASAGRVISHHPHIAKVTFTGSTKSGKNIIRASADPIKKLSLELGGKSPHIVFADAKLDEAVEWAFQGVFANAGQSCSAGSRIYVQSSVHDEFLSKLIKRVKSVVLGCPFEPKTTQGPQISEAQMKSILNHIERAQKQGAKIETGGRRRQGVGYYMEPTVLSGCRQDMDIVHEEVFGPVVSVSSFGTLEEAIRLANDTQYGLGSGVHTQSISTAMACIDKIKAGNVWVNCYDVLQTGTCFGGFKQSGIGKELGEYALADYTNIKQVVIKT
ncbi:hypothetical protein BZG36_02113 [Bifiguratus adelaidae]|uniref:Aldehyde dehydrogenase domain-containing protein n=1 Tax=Bifiguratus adelaidae TaxID=1938954 RepID=A0A261Y311_9FUNG|nr:hypothetical protein BZG36_02113 [Bifiguratus adelaidae]